VEYSLKSSFGLFAMLVLASASMVLPAFHSTVLALPSDQLVGYWKFDEGSGLVAGDSSGNGNNGTLRNGPVWVTGISGGALSLDGTDDYVEVLNVTDFDFNQPLTLSALLFLKDASSGGIIGQWGHGGEGGDAFMLSLSAGLLQGSLQQPPLYDLYSVSTIGTDEWTHVAMVYNGSTLELYVNGALDAFGSVSANPENSSQTVKIGLENIFPTMHYLNGTIDEVSIYNRALSATEIMEMYTDIIPEFPTLLIMPLLAISTLIALAIRKKERLA
jgi:hypothetical protein